MFSTPFVTRRVEVGSIARQPVTIQLYVPSVQMGLLSLQTTSEALGLQVHEGCMMRGAKLPPICNLDQARSLMEKTKKASVPEHGTADAWVEEYATFCGGSTSEEKRNDFTSLLLFRTEIPRGETGHLHSTSVLTYIRYILKDRRFYKHTYSAATKALETKASKEGPIRKAPTLSEELQEQILQYVHNGPESDLTQKKKKKKEQEEKLTIPLTLFWTTQPHIQQFY